MVDGIGSSTSGPPSGVMPVVAAAPSRTSDQAEAFKTLQESKSPVQVIYNSPAFKIDPEANMAIFVVRNRETGAVINQYPSEKIVQEYKRADAERTAKLREHVKAAAEKTADIVSVSAEAAQRPDPAKAEAPAPKVEAAKVTETIKATAQAEMKAEPPPAAKPEAPKPEVKTEA